jgi:hypothetical protein
MRTPTLLVGILCAALPAAAQSRVYTNADLTTHPVTSWTRTVTAAELASLREHQTQVAAPRSTDAPVIRLTPEPQPVPPTTSLWIAQPAGYTRDMHIFNAVSLWQARQVRRASLAARDPSARAGHRTRH